MNGMSAAVVGSRIDRDIEFGSIYIIRKQQVRPCCMKAQQESNGMQDSKGAVHFHGYHLHEKSVYRRRHKVRVTPFRQLPHRNCRIGKAHLLFNSRDSSLARPMFPDSTCCRILSTFSRVTYSSTSLACCSEILPARCRFAIVSIIGCSSCLPKDRQARFSAFWQ